MKKCYFRFFDRLMLSFKFSLASNYLQVQVVMIDLYTTLPNRYNN